MNLNLKKNMLAGVVSALAISSANAAPYQAEVGFSYAESTVEFGSASADADATAFTGTFYFKPVTGTKGPLAEASFVEKASSVSFGYAKFDPENGDSSDSTVVFGRVVTDSDLTIQASYENGEDDNFVQVGVGSYISNTAEVSLTYMTNTDSDFDRSDYQLAVKEVKQLSQGRYLSYRVAATFIDAESDNGHAIGGVFTYFVHNKLGFGPGLSFGSLGDSDVTTVSAHASVFPVSNVKLSAEYSSSENDFGADDTLDSRTLTLAVDVRI